jgi:holin-like protein
MIVFIGIFILLAYLAMGNLLSVLLGGFFPGSVLGMLLLFLSLLAGIVKDKWIRPVATFLTDNMMIFFMPAFMGIMDPWGIVKMDFWAWIAVIFFSTLLVLMATGLVEAAVEHFRDRKNGTTTNKELEV